MAAFFREVLDRCFTPDFLYGVRKKFHFAETQMREMQEVAMCMAPRMHKEAFWERKADFIQGRHCMEKPGRKYEIAAMSLGSGIDHLQERYSAEGLLLQSYILEVLAGEILMEGYPAYQQYIKKETGWRVAAYHFPGSEEALPLELLPELLQECAPQITCNAAFAMSPAQSVLFLAELAQDGRIECGSLCQGCRQSSCPNRIRAASHASQPMTYGYSRIFGLYP
ncbi:MAG: hypothetical protein K2N87_15270 [Eubacterium sp.]|nr:hypothetical protein [Eubacterium sp.]